MGWSDVIRFLVKEGYQKGFERMADSFDINEGENEGHLIKTGDREYIYVGIWDSEEALAGSRDNMIGDLDQMRIYLEETATRVTDPRSDPIVLTH